MTWRPQLAIGIFWAVITATGGPTDGAIIRFGVQGDLHNFRRLARESVACFLVDAATQGCDFLRFWVTHWNTRIRTQ